MAAKDLVVAVGACWSEGDVAAAEGLGDAQGAALEADEAAGLHARRAGEIMAECGYGAEEIARTGSLLKKERLKQDPDAQTLEDVICLVFLAHESEAFIAKHDDDKVRDILAKTAKKMSAPGLAAAAQAPMGERLARLLGEALG